MCSSRYIQLIVGRTTWKMCGKSWKILLVFTLITALLLPRGRGHMMKILNSASPGNAAAAPQNNIKTKRFFSFVLLFCNFVIAVQMYIMMYELINFVIKYFRQFCIEGNGHLWCQDLKNVWKTDVKKDLIFPALQRKMRNIRNHSLIRLMR